jgi:predicted XRE-type DNA-binding protein
MPIGSNFNDFLKSEGLYEDCTAAAIKKNLAWEIADAMKAQSITKTAMAEKLKTSRAALNRLLDATDTSLTLKRLASAAAALGKQVRFQIA